MKGEVLRVSTTNNSGLQIKEFGIYSEINEMSLKDFGLRSHVTH